MNRTFGIPSRRQMLRSLLVGEFIYVESHTDASTMMKQIGSELTRMAKEPEFKKNVYKQEQVLGILTTRRKLVELVRVERIK